MKILLSFSLLISSIAYSQCSELFFSEYIEGSSSNKAFEIYNPTSEPIDLDDYVVYRNNNGSLTPTDSLFPHSMLAPGEVYVVGNPSANADILIESDTTHTMTFYNGDDALWLKKISTGDTLDIIGEIGVDPGSGWTVGAGATNNFTLVRNIDIQQGQTNWILGSTEWMVFPIDMIDSLGAHSMSACAPCATEAFVEDTVCNEFISPSGEYTWTESGTYMDTIPNVAGCDSVITFDLTIHHNTGNFIITSACDALLSPSGDELWTESGLYTDTIPNFHGCDSVITINLSISYSTSAFQEITVCDSLLSPSEGYVWTTSGTYNDTIVNVAGCDSIIITDLTVLYSSASTMDVIACKSFIAPSGKLLTTNGTHKDTITNITGCDSVITIDLTILNVDVSVTQDGNELMADNPIEFFQWLDCDNDYAEIPGATERTYIATSNGNYAVEITQDGCTDTSACYSVYDVSIPVHPIKHVVLLYPNPNNGAFTLELMQSMTGLVNIHSITGQLLASYDIANAKAIPIQIQNGAGIYFLEVISAENETIVIKILVQ